MSFFSNIRRNVRKAFTSKSWSRGSSGMSSHMKTRQHPLQKLFARCWDYGGWDNPRSRMEISRLIIRTVPFFRRAIEMQSQFIGTLEVVTENDELREVLEKFISEVPIRFQDNPEYSFFFGLDNYNRQLIKVAYMDGLAFSEEMYGSMGESDEDTGALLDGLMVFKSEEFDFGTKDGKKVLVFKGNKRGKQIVVRESDHFTIFGVSFLPGSLWGLTMVDGGEFFAEILIQMLIARKNNYVRLGSPPGLNMFVLENWDGFQGGDYDEFKNRVDEAEEKFMDAIYASQEGKAAEVFIKMGGSVKYDHKMYGDGAQGLQGFHEDFKMVVNMLGHLTGIPVELWLDSSAAGLGSDKYRIQNGLLSAGVNTNRGLLRPVNMRICKNYLYSIGAPPEWVEGFELRYRDLDIADEKEIADTANTRADAVSKHVDNALRLWQEMGYSLDDLNRYFEQVGLDFIHVEDMPDPEPEPEDPPQLDDPIEDEEEEDDDDEA